MVGNKIRRPCLANLNQYKFFVFTVLVSTFTFLFVFQNCSQNKGSLQQIASVNQGAATVKVACAKDDEQVTLQIPEELNQVSEESSATTTQDDGVVRQDESIYTWTFVDAEGNSQTLDFNGTSITLENLAFFRDGEFRVIMPHHSRIKVIIFVIVTDIDVIQPPVCGSHMRVVYHPQLKTCKQVSGCELDKWLAEGFFDVASTTEVTISCEDQPRACEVGAHLNSSGECVRCPPETAFVNGQCEPRFPEPKVCNMEFAMMIHPSDELCIAGHNGCEIDALLAQGFVRDTDGVCREKRPGCHTKTDDGVCKGCAVGFSYDPVKDLCRKDTQQCTMIAGWVKHVDTKQCQQFTNGCELSDLKAKGFVESSEEECRSKPTMCLPLQTQMIHKTTQKCQKAKDTCDRAALASQGFRKAKKKECK